MKSCKLCGDPTFGSEICVNCNEAADMFSIDLEKEIDEGMDSEDVSTEERDTKEED